MKEEHFQEVRQVVIRNLREHVLREAFSSARMLMKIRYPEVPEDDYGVEHEWTCEVLDYVADLVVEICSDFGYGITGWGSAEGARWLIFGEDFDYPLPGDEDVDPKGAYRFREDYFGVPSFHRLLCQRLALRGWLPGEYAEHAPERR